MSPPRARKPPGWELEAGTLTQKLFVRTPVAPFLAMSSREWRGPGQFGGGCCTAPVWFGGRCSQTVQFDTWIITVWSPMCDKYSYSHLYSRIPFRLLVFVFDLFFVKPNIFVFLSAKNILNEI